MLQQEEKDAVLSAQTEVKFFFDFLMTPDGEGSEGMMGNDFSCVFVRISSQRKTKRERCSLKKVDLERKSPEPPA